MRIRKRYRESGFRDISDMVRPPRISAHADGESELVGPHRPFKGLDDVTRIVVRA
jgi:hypothetical protein